MDFNFISHIGKIAQSLLAIAVIVISVGVGISLAKFGTVNFNQKIEALESYVERDKKQAMELRQTIVEDENMGKHHPQILEVAKQQLAEIDKPKQTLDEIYKNYDIDELARVGKTIIKDKYGKYYEATSIIDVFIVDAKDPFPVPSGRLELTFAEMIINIEYLKDILEDNKFKVMMPQVMAVEEAQNELIEMYKKYKGDNK